MLPKVAFVMHLKHEAKGYTINCAEGNSFYTFFHFINPVTIRINGKMLHTMPNACCIFSPCTAQYVEATDFPLLHDYICFSADMPFPIEHLDSVFYVCNHDEISAAVEDIQYNFNNRDVDERVYTERIEKGVAWLFNLINQSFLMKKPSETGKRSDYNLQQIRREMYASVREWNVDRMIQESFMSRAQFYRKYKDLFQIAPNDDIIRAAMLTAENLLINSHISISDIAYEVGYDSVDYFIRCFKRHYNMSPGKFRSANKQ